MSAAATTRALKRICARHGTCLADRTAVAPLSQVLATEVLPALSESDSRTALRSLARAYRRAAAAAPTRPHAWLLDTATGSDGSSVAGTPTAGRAGRWVSAAVGAAGRAVKAPVRAGIALADAVADAAHFGPSHTLLKA